jgi:hypothetical protein
VICPKCGIILTRKDVATGKFRCPCGWKDDLGEFAIEARNAIDPIEPDDKEWLPDTNSVALH